MNDSEVANENGSTDRFATNNGDASEESIDDNLSNNAEVHTIDPLAIIKVEVPLYEVHAANNDEINQILDEAEEIVCDDDVIMSIGKDGIPKPWAATDDKIIKRQNDPMSGDIAFNVTVSRIFHKHTFHT